MYKKRKFYKIYEHKVESLSNTENFATLASVSSLNLETKMFVILKFSLKILNFGLKSCDPN